MSEEDMALGHKASRGETGLMGKLKKLLRGEQVPFSEKLYNKMFSEDDREYWRLEELLGKDIMKQHAEIWGSKNPDSNLADFNKYVADWAADVDNVYLSDKTDEEYKAMGMQAGGEVKPGMLDFAWKKYIEGSQEYRESQQDLYMQDKEYWDNYKAHRGYLDTVKNDAEARHSIKEMDSFGYGTTRG